MLHLIGVSRGNAGTGQTRQEDCSPTSIQFRQVQSPTASTPGLTPELRQLINADVDVHRAASLDIVCDSSDMDSGDRFHVGSSTHENTNHNTCFMVLSTVFKLFIRFCT